MPSLSLYIDTTARQLVQSFTNPLPATLPPVNSGDSLSVTLFPMAQTGVPSAPYAYLNYSTLMVKAFLGVIAGVPASGFLTLTDGTNISGNIPFNDNPVDVQAQIASLDIWTNPTVTGGIGGPWVITNGVNGALPVLTGNAAGLNPSSSLVITQVAMGSATTPAINLVRLALNPIASQTTWTRAGSPTYALTGLLTPLQSTLQQLWGTLLSFKLALQIVTIDGVDVETIVSTTLTMNNTISIGPIITLLETESGQTLETESGIDIST